MVGFYAHIKKDRSVSPSNVVIIPEIPLIVKVAMAILPSNIEPAIGCAY